MKKTLITVFVALVAASAFNTRALAQDDGLVIASSKNNATSLELLSHWGWGYNLVNNSSFTCSDSGEFFVNIAELYLYPVSFFGLEVGVDYKTIYFTSKEQAFYLNGYKDVNAMPYSLKYPGSITKNFSRVRTNTFSVPAVVKFKAGNFALGVGAEANLNLTGRIKDKYFENGKKVKNIEKGVQFNRYMYNLLAMVSFYDTSIYARYYPKGTSLFTEGGAYADFMTIGIGFDF